MAKISLNIKRSILSFIILLLMTISPVYAQNEKSKVKKENYFSGGIGYGIPYGVLGINIEFNPNLSNLANPGIHNYFSCSLGVGFSPAGATYSVGLRLYPLGRGEKILPRISGYYGTVALIEYGNDDYDRREGFALGGGVLYKLSKKISVDFDLIIILLKDLDDSRFKISFGIHRHF